MKATMNTIALVVSDIEASIAFYARLGIDLEVDPKYPDHAGADLPSGIHLMLDTEKSRTPFLPGWAAPTGGPRVLLCVEFPGSAEVDATYADLVGAGYRGVAEPWDAYWGMRYATVLDPDGTGVDLYSRLPAG